MFSFPGVVALVLLIFVRPQEVFPVVRFVPLLDVFFGVAIPMLYVVVGLAGTGMLLDVRLGLARLRSSPQLPWVALFFLYCLVSVVLKAPSLGKLPIDIAILFVWYFLPAHGLSGFRVFRALCLVLVLVTLFLALIGVHQGLQPFECVKIQEGAVTSAAEGVADGRPCRDRQQCLVGGERGADYLCERIGVMNTSTIGGRVRYRGILLDPNELGVTLCLALPLVLALAQIRRRTRTWLFALLTIGVTAWCVRYTQSRTGQIVLLCVLCVHFVRQLKLRGLLLLGVLAVPLALALAGSGRADDVASTNERLECWLEGMQMFRSSPFLGVGFDQFTEHHFLTAHNSYILALAELGAPGTALWIGVLYVSAKIPWVALRRYRGFDRHPPDGPLTDRAEAVTWAMALLAVLAGLLVGMFFLSFCYHYTLWIYLALCGTFYQTVKTHDPAFEVRIGLGDLLLVLGVTGGLIVGLQVLTRVMAAT